jgi:hypothetical protein
MINNSEIYIRYYFEKFRKLFFCDNFWIYITSIKKLFYIHLPAPSWDGVPIQKDGGGICFSRKNMPLLNSLTLIFDYALKSLIDIKSISNNRAKEIWQLKWVYEVKLSVWQRHLFINFFYMVYKKTDVTSDKWPFIGHKSFPFFTRFALRVNIISLCYLHLLHPL